MNLKITSHTRNEDKTCLGLTFQNVNTLVPFYPILN